MRLADRVVRPLAVVTALAVLAALAAGCPPGPSVEQGNVAAAGSTGATSAAPANADRRGELRIEGRVREISLAPNGRIWLTDAFGNSYSADSVNGDWRYGPLRNTDTSFITRGMGSHIDRITFFDDREAIASGYLIDDGPPGAAWADRRAFLLRTADGGATWDTLRFAGEPFWVYDVFTLGDDVWLGGSSGVLHHSADRGRTWTAIATPYDGSSRLASIFMASRDTGWIGALDDAIAATTDGGRTWRALPTPLGQRLFSRPDDDAPSDRIDRMIRFGDWLVARENGRVFRTRLDPVAWETIPGGALLDVALDREADRLVAVREDLRVVAFDRRWRATELGDRPLPARPVHLVARGGVAYTLDDGRALAAVSRDTLVHSHPTTTGHATPTVYEARRRGDRLVGVTQHHVYESADDGKSWYRIGTVHSPIEGILPRGDGEYLLWDRHGTNLVLDRSTGETRPAAGLAWDVVDIVPHPTGWVAFGGMQYQTSFRVEVAQTFSGGQFRGTRDTGWVAVSADSGRTWREVDVWPNEGVAYAHVRPGGDLVLLSWLGSVRVVERTGEGAGATYAGRTVLTADTTNADEVPYVQQPHAVYFEDDRTGWIGGWIHHIGNRHFRTTDGGRTWSRAAEHRFPYLQLVPAGDGWVGRTERSLTFLRGGERREIEVPGLSGMPGGITDVSVDDRGRLLVELNENEYGDPSDVRKRWITVPLPPR